MTATDVKQGRLGESSFRLLFLHSQHPMLIADDQRRFVDANPAACLFLRCSPDAVRELTIDDLNPPAVRPGMEAIWEDFLAAGGPPESRPAVPWDLQMPDGAIVAVDICGIPHVEPGLHLAVIRFPAARDLDEDGDPAPSPNEYVISKREREILSMVAAGHTGLAIAAQLFLSPATVETHVTNALMKLGARNRAHGIATALRLGELDLDGEGELSLLVRSQGRSNGRPPR